jgi:hypothetical protein
MNKATKACQSYLGQNRNIDRKSLLRICPCLPVLLVELLRGYDFFLLDLICRMSHS